MILCLCKGISDRKIKEMAQAGQTLREIVETSEASTCCGACATDLRELVKSETSKAKATTGLGNPCS